MSDASRPDPTEHLPLPPSMYNVLLALGERTLHGYGMIRVFEEMTGGAETLLPGTLYATIARMVDDGLLEETDRPPDADPSGGPRRRYYRVTGYGRAVARAESERLARLLDVARAQDLAAETGR